MCQNREREREREGCQDWVWEGPRRVNAAAAPAPRGTERQAVPGQLEETCLRKHLSFPTFPVWLSPAAPPQLGQGRARECGADPSGILRSVSYWLPRKENMAKKQCDTQNCCSLPTLPLQSLFAPAVTDLPGFLSLEMEEGNGAVGCECSAMSSAHWVQTAHFLCCCQGESLNQCPKAEQCCLSDPFDSSCLTSGVQSFGVQLTSSAHPFTTQERCLK